MTLVCTVLMHTAADTTLSSTSIPPSCQSQRPCVWFPDRLFEPSELWLAPTGASLLPPRTSLRPCLSRDLPRTVRDLGSEVISCRPRPRALACPCRYEWCTFITWKKGTSQGGKSLTATAAAMNDPGLDQPAQEAAQDVEKSAHFHYSPSELEQREFLDPRYAVSSVGQTAR